MKANVHLIYKDGFEACFDYNDDKPQDKVDDVLLTVCYGCLMASCAVRVVAYNEEGLEICSYEKSTELAMIEKRIIKKRVQDPFALTKKMFKG